MSATFDDGGNIMPGMGTRDWFMVAHEQEKLIAGLRKIIAERPVAPHPVDVARRLDAFMSECDFPKVLGVSRDADNDRVLLVSFAERPDDDDLREFHDFIARRPAPPPGDAETPHTRRYSEGDE